MSDEEKLKLKPANENPWYCLATLYGEREEKGDDNLDKQNRVAWNRWIAAALSQEQREEFLRKGVDASELVPFSKKEITEFLKAFAKRTNFPPPDPKEAIDFHSVHFERTISFGGFIFPTNVLFDEAAFAGFAYFHKAAFSSFTNFKRTTFSGFASFQEATFAAGSTFSEAIFSTNVTFEKAIFSLMCIFNKATFSGRGDFSGAIFSCSAFFNNVNFFQPAFEKTTFSEGAFFDGSTVANNAFFSKATFAEDTSFSRVEFAGRAEFTSCEFSSNISFAGAKFKSQVPAFYDTKFREGIVWGQSTWPPPPKDKEQADRQVYAYERLKAEMERLNRNLEAQFFFAHELRAQRERETRYSPRRALNFAYQILSGYGQSVRLPVFWLVMVFIFGFGFFALVPVYNGAPISYGEAAGLSITNLISFLPYKVDNDISAHLSPFAKIIGDLQSLLGVILLFLLGLALRNRFRMK